VTNHDDEMEGTHCLVERLYSTQTQCYNEELIPLLVRLNELALAVKEVLCRGVFLDAFGRKMSFEPQSLTRVHNRAMTIRASVPRRA
jgi:hypothetical protein